MLSAQWGVKAEEAVTKGEAISAAFADERLIAPAVYEAMRNGEKSGQIGPLLLHVADFLDEENEIIVKSLTTILEPVIMIVPAGSALQNATSVNSAGS